MPFDIPFSQLLQLAIIGNSGSKISPQEVLPGSSIDAALSIVNRIIFDQKLVKKIVIGVIRDNRNVFKPSQFCVQLFAECSQKIMIRFKAEIMKR